MLSQKTKTLKIYDLFLITAQKLVLNWRQENVLRSH